MRTKTRELFLFFFTENGGESVGYDNDGESGELRRAQQIGDELLGDGVDGRAGLVQQQHATGRIKESAGKTASKGNKLKLARRKRRTRLTKQREVIWN
jgi:hypothetical protein